MTSSVFFASKKTLRILGWSIIGVGALISATGVVLSHYGLPNSNYFGTGGLAVMTLGVLVLAK